MRLADVFKAATSKEVFIKFSFVYLLRRRCNVAVSYIMDCQSAVAMALVVIIKFLSSKSSIHANVRSRCVLSK